MRSRSIGFLSTGKILVSGNPIKNRFRAPVVAIGSLLRWEDRVPPNESSADSFRPDSPRDEHNGKQDTEVLTPQPTAAVPTLVGQMPLLPHRHIEQAPAQDTAARSKARPRSAVRAP